MKLTPRLIGTAHISSNFSNSRSFNFAIKKHPISPALTSVYLLCNSLVEDMWFFFTIESLP